jgi:lipopolysaccharide/colanic/teichoic acid biosynthesis glycosyltransferase
MRQDVKKAGPLVSGWRQSSPRGAFIRVSPGRTAQFFNILHGTMSLVGPRRAALFCENWKPPIFAQRHTVRPHYRLGSDQVPYGFQRGSAKRKLELDLFYIKHLSISLDLAVIFETVKVILLGKGAK